MSWVIIFSEINCRGRTSILDYRVIMTFYRNEEPVLFHILSGGGDLQKQPKIAESISILRGESDSVVCDYR